MLVELKNGETLNGHLINSDTWMNLTLKEVVQTSPDGDKFFSLPEVYVRGNNVCLKSTSIVRMRYRGLTLCTDQVFTRSGRDHRRCKGATTDTAIEPRRKRRRTAWRSRREGRTGQGS